MSPPIPTPRFNHLYIEKDALEHPLTQRIIKYYATSAVFHIDRYSEVFNKKRQHFHVQKANPALIVSSGKYKKQLLYRGNERVATFGDLPLYYVDQLRNCIFDCEYCFLQGMHRSAHSLLFVNTEDYFSEVRQLVDVDVKPVPQATTDNRQLSQRRYTIHLSISYLSDTLGIEHVFGLCEQWIEFVRGNTRVLLEIRTKSDNINALHHLTPSDNVRLVWSLTPASLAKRFEHGTASTKNRIMAAKAAIHSGWKIHLAFDPILIVDEWKQQYAELFAEVFDKLGARSIEAISFGTLRMYSGYYQNMLQLRPQRNIMIPHNATTGTLSTLPHDVVESVKNEIAAQITKYYPQSQLHFVHG